MVVAGAMAYLAIKTELSANTFFAHEVAARKDALALRLVSVQQKATALGATTLRNAYRLLLAVMGDEWALTQLKVIAIGRKQLAISKLTTFLLQHETLARRAATASMKLYNLAQGEGVIAGIARWIVGKLNVATFIQEGTAAWFATAAVNALNMAFFYILIPIGIVLAVFWLILQVVNKITGSSYSLAEVLMGALGVAVAFITNLFIGLYNVVIAVANAIGSLFGQKYEKMDYVDYGEYYDRYSKKFSNNSLLNYSMDNQDYSDILSDDLMAGIDGILGNTGEIANNTSMTSQDVEFLRAMAENRVITRMNTMTINITNNNEMSVNSEMDLDGISEYMANSLTEAFSKSARGVHL